MRIGVILTAVLHLAGELALGQVQTFRNDYPGFVAAAGPVSTITFDHLPDGTPSAGHVGTPITSTFNYDVQGAHFSAPNVDPIIAGNTTTGFELLAWTGQFGPHTWIIADLTNPARAVGIFFPSIETLCAFDASGTQLGCVSYVPQPGGQGPFFLGIVSSVPIARMTADEHPTSSGESISALAFVPVPEPATAVLLAFGSVLALRSQARVVRRP